MTLYRKLEKHKSHLDFVKACLRNDVIPWGLRMKSVPMVSDIGGMKRDLSHDWNKTLRKTSQLLLGHLKSYHRAVILALGDEIRDAEVNLRTHNDFEESLTIVQHMVDKTSHNYNQRKKKKNWRD